MAPQTSGAGPIKVGVITDQTGPLSVIGRANANVAMSVVTARTTAMTTLGSTARASHTRGREACRRA